MNKSPHPAARFTSGDPPPPREGEKNVMDRFIDSIEWIAAFFVGIVALKTQRWIDVFATLVLLFVVTVQTYTLFDKVADTRASHIVTMDLQVPVWPFFLVAWIGDVSAVLLIAIRTYRLIFHPDLMHDP